MSSGVGSHHGKSKDGSGSSSKHHQPKEALLTTPTRSFSKIKPPTLDAYKRIHSESFPILDSDEIHRLIASNSQSSTYTNLHSSATTLASSSSSSFHSQSQLHQTTSQQHQQPRNHLCRPHLVPYGPPIETVRNMSAINRQLLSLAEFTQPRIFHSTQRFNNNEQNLLLQIGVGSADNSTGSNSRKFEAIAQCVHHIFDNNYKV